MSEASPSPEERAEALVEANVRSWFFDDGRGMWRCDTTNAKADIAAAIKAALIAEREADARLLDGLDHDCRGLCADAIRSRSETPPV